MRPAFEANFLDIKNVKILRVFLGCCGAWPGEMFGEKVPFLKRHLKRYLLIQTVFSLFLLAHFIVHYSKDVNFMVLGHCYISFIVSVVTVVRLAVVNLKKYGVLMKHFFSEFHLVHYRHNGEHYEKMYTLIDKLSYYCTLMELFFSVIGVLPFNLSPIYQSYKIGAYTGNTAENTTVIFAAYFSFPGFNPYDWIILTTIINLLLTHVVTVAVCALDLLLYIMVFQIIGHVLLLRENLSLLPMPKKQISMDYFNNKGQKKGSVIVEKFDVEENSYIRKKLAECVDHHRLIITFANDMSNFFGYMLAINYLYHLICCCLLLMECASADMKTIITFGPLTFITFGQLIQISFIFEIVGTVSEKLKDSIYDIPWECMDTGNRRTVCIMLNRMQNPITVRAMGMTPVGVTTMAAILKTTFTYFMFLKSIEE